MATNVMAVRVPPINKPRRLRNTINVNGRQVYTTIAVQKAGRTTAQSVMEGEILLHLAYNHNINITV